VKLPLKSHTTFSLSILLHYIFFLNLDISKLTNMRRSPSSLIRLLPNLECGFIVQRNRLCQISFLLVAPRGFGKPASEYYELWKKVSNIITINFNQNFLEGPVALHASFATFANIIILIPDNWGGAKTPLFHLFQPTIATVLLLVVLDLPCPVQLMLY